MTIGEYISEKFQSFGVSNVQLYDFALSTSLDINTDISTADKGQLGLGIISLIEELALAPLQKSVSENGFSVSWDFSNMGRYYLLLCKKYGADPDSDVMKALGLSVITDKSDIW